jgi:DNA-binding transcriptional ArsR family regulator
VSRVDLKRLQLAPTASRMARPHRTEPFIKGPIPLDWVKKASKLSHKSLHVGMALWFFSGLQKSRTVRLCPRQAAAFGVGRTSFHRALGALEEAGLIRANRRRGRCPIVTIVE